MKTPSADPLMDLGHALAQDLMEVARSHGIPPRDLIMGLTVAQRILQSVLYPGRTMTGIQAEMEGDATYVASSTRLEGN